MTDRINRARRSENMRRIKSRNTKPELIVRSVAHRLGFRFRLHRKDLPGKPDLVFPSKNKVIFVHGCFWHKHPLKSCLDSSVPKSNVDYWETKLTRNVEKDKIHIASLVGLGYQVLIIWDCETKNEEELSKKIKLFLS